MSETPPLKAMRLKLIEALDDRQYSAEQLDAVLETVRDKVPELFAPHEDLDDFAIEEDPLKWYQTNYVYYTKQKMAAESNFSEKRLRHLLAMREYFRERRYAGFVPPLPANHGDLKDIERIAEEMFAAHDHWSVAPDADAQQGGKRNGQNHDEFAAKQARMETGNTISIPERNQSMYQASDNLERSVETGNLTAVRVALQQEMGKRQLSQQDLLAALAWVKLRQPEIFCPYEESKFTYPIGTQRDAWDVDYHDKQMVSLENNFSEKRFLHVLEVREYLREQKAPGFEPLVTPKTAPEAPAIQPGTSRASGSPRTKDAPAPSAPPLHSPDDEGMSPALLKKILMIGGALAAALLALLFSLGR
jgi:hypothetical protein